MGSMKPILLLAMVALMAADPPGETHNQKLERVLKAAKADAAEKIPELKESTKALAAELKRLPKAKIVAAAPEPPKTFLSQKEKEAYLADLKAKLAEDTAELKRLKEGGILIPTIETPLSLGVIGYWPAPWFNTEHVLSPSEVICSRRGDSFLLRGVPTADMADGKTVVIGKAVYEVTGTYTYQTVRGAARTIPVVEPFKLERE
jgi:hypothetical protein